MGRRFIVENSLPAPLALSGALWQTQGVKRAILSVALVLVTAVAALVVWHFARPSAAAHTALPNPNGYDDFARAALEKVPWNRSLNEMPSGEVREIVQQNAEALKHVRQGLKKQSAVPVTNEVAWSAWRLPYLAANKNMAQLLVAEGMIALEERRTNDAARCFTECITFGHAAHRHGLMIDDLVALACQGLGAEKLTPIAAGISNDVRRGIVQELWAVDADRENAAKVIERDRVWARGAYGPLKTAWSQLVLRKSLRQMETNFISRHERLTASLRVIVIDLAVRGYMAENNGKPPQKLDDLIPKWLPTVPIDPVINKPFIYQADSNSFSLSGGTSGMEDKPNKSRR